MFRRDMAAQGRKLMVMIDTVVARLDRLRAARASPLQALGQRHAGYGVADEHYAIVGTALLDTLRAGLGDPSTRRSRRHGPSPTARSPG